MDRIIEPKVRLRRQLRRAAIVTGIAVVAWVAFSFVLGFARPSVKRSRIRTAEVERGRVEATFTAAGIVVPDSEKIISSPVEATVTRVVRRAGADLRTGDTIVELDLTPSRLALQRLEQQAVQKSNESMKLRLTAAEAERDVESRIESKRLDVEVLSYKLQQSQSLRKEGLTSEESLRQAEVAWKKATIELEQLRRSLESSRRSAAIQQKAADADAALAQSDRAEAARQLELASLRADRDGVLTWIGAREGATIRRGDVIARVADLGSYRIEASVSDLYAARLRTATPVRIKAGDGTAIGGRISSIDPTVENGVVKFQIALDDPAQPGLRNNQRVEVEVLAGARDSVLRLPAGAWTDGGSAKTAFVIRGNRAMRVPVRLGIGGSEHQEIEEGLQPGDEVIVSDMADYERLAEVRVH